MNKQERKQKDDKKSAAKLSFYHLFGLLSLLLFMMISVFLFPIPFHIKTFFLGFAVATVICISMTYYIFKR